VSQFAGEPPWDRGLIDKGLLRPALIEGGRE
jgi:hypothetical protein